MQVSVRNSEIRMLTGFSVHSVAKVHRLRRITTAGETRAVYGSATRWTEIRSEQGVITDLAVVEKLKYCSHNEHDHMSGQFHSCKQWMCAAVWQWCEIYSWAEENCRNMDAGTVGDLLYLDFIFVGHILGGTNAIRLSGAAGTIFSIMLQFTQRLLFGTCDIS